MLFFSSVVATAMFRSISGRGPENAHRRFANISTCKFLDVGSAEAPDLTFCSIFQLHCVLENIWHSFMHLFTLLTTANYPDV